MQNTNCDGSHCRAETGDVKLLPMGGGNGNLILCRPCFAHEVAWRRERNRALSVAAQYALPDWDYLTTYGGAL